MVQKAPHAVGSRPAQLDLDAFVLIRVSGDDAHPVDAKQPGQLFLQLRQAVELPVQRLHLGQHLLAPGRQGHACSVKADEAALLEGVGCRADLPLRQAQAHSQLSPAHRGHGGNALQHQCPQRHFLCQIRRKGLHQLYESVLHLQRLLAGMFCPSGHKPARLFYHVQAHLARVSRG